MEDIDIQVTSWLNALAGRNACIDFLMVLISTWAVPVLIIAVAAQWWAGKRDRDRHIIVAAGLSFIVGLAINQAILLFIQRLRPYELGLTHLIVARSSDPSFPSDHATATFAIAGAFLLHKAKWRGVAFLAAALVVSLSRVFIGTHYASDVVGGAVTGLLAASTIRAVYRPGSRFDRFVTGLL
jgi:undecaprenyl-diphosphatase